MDESETLSSTPTKENHYKSKEVGIFLFPIFFKNRVNVYKKNSKVHLKIVLLKVNFFVLFNLTKKICS